jgi:hypothetical protein
MPSLLSAVRLRKQRSLKIHEKPICEACPTEVSKARADAIRREADALKDSPELIQLRTVEKWDGVLPRVNGSQAVPFLNIGSEVEQKTGR